MKLFLSLSLAVAFLTLPSYTSAEESTRCVLLEMFVQENDANAEATEQALRNYVKSHKAITVHVYNVDESEDHRERFQQVKNYFQMPNTATPAIYGCRYLLHGINNLEELPNQLDAMLTVTLFTRTGCPKCQAAKDFVARVQHRYPCFKFVVYDILTDAGSQDRLQQLSTKYQIAAPNLPAFHLCNELSIGYLGDEITGQKMMQVLDFWTVPCDSQVSLNPPTQPIDFESLTPRITSFVPFVLHAVMIQETEPESSNSPQSLPPLLPIPGGSPPPPLIGSSVPTDTSLPPPPGPLPNSSTDISSPPSLNDPSNSEIQVPVFGTLSVVNLGMPTFTFLIGLADGFNPCAMWVLLFLLSVLVNLKSRMKILAVAGTFVVISGLAYYAFMAAWLNVFMLIGYLRPVQIALGLTAIVVGSIHIKDFFAFKQGISLSIPESAKPSIYQHVRNIVSAHSLFTAIVGATILAVMVNIVELLCTAGLPALYTQILTMQEYPPWKNYLYLGVYILAYMLDDALMVGVVVFTMERHKLQEQQGRWLKLISGLFIAVLGLVMLLNPELLS